MYEISSDDINQPTYSTIDDQSKASAPATATKPVVTNAAENSRTQPSAPSPRSSTNDFTLVDNDLYG